MPRFEVGDWVVVIDVVQNCHRYMVGRHTLVIELYEDGRVGTLLSRSTTSAHRAAHLKKIDPPDWEAVRHVVKEEDGHRSKSS